MQFLKYSNSESVPLYPDTPVTAARRVEPRFEESSSNNSLITANIGESVALHCRIWMKQVGFISLSTPIDEHSFEFLFILCKTNMKYNYANLQSATVSWSVNRGTSMDLLTVGNTTFSGDQRYSVVFQNPTDWALVIENVKATDAGKYICTLETFPKQSLIIFLQVNGDKQAL